MVLKPYQILLCGYIFSDRAWARQEILHLGAWIICVLGARLYGSLVNHAPLGLSA